MTISSNSKVDFLWKKVIFGATKTDSDTAKAGNNESIPSLPSVYGNQIWKQTDVADIPATPPSATTSVIDVRKGSARVQCTEDTTAGGPGVRPTWLTGLADWIPPTFGSPYAVEVFLGDPEAGGVKIFPGAVDQEWVFDYNAGVLHFPTNLPTSNPKWSQGVYIKGYRYIGPKGLGGAGGAVYRNTWTYTTPNLGIGSEHEFEIELGAALIIYNLSLSKPCLVEIFGTSARSEPNPYSFLATDTHLVDDGTTLLNDGSVIKTRQYSIFANLESPVLPKVYARITNTSDSDGEVELSILYFSAVTDIAGPITPSPSPAPSPSSLIQIIAAASHDINAANTGSTMSKNAGTINILSNVQLEGESFSIFNSSSTTPISLVQGAGLTLKRTPGLTGDRTLAPYGHATVLFLSSTEAVIHGDGIS